MAGTNDFKSLATGVGANVLTQAEYEALASLLANGFTSGVADSKTINKALRQSSFVAEAIAKIIADNNVNALDDGDVATFKDNLLAAIFVSATTPPQFDNDTSLATTAFVQRALGSLSACKGIGASQSLTAADAGKLIQLSTGGAHTVTLPAASTVADGTSFTFVNTGTSPGTIQRAGADVISTNGASINSFSLGVGDFAVLVKYSTVWVLFGSVSLPDSPLFAKSLATSGYQKLPSGLIIQWGTGTTPAGGLAGTFTFPISFPTAALSIAESVIGGSSNNLDGIEIVSFTASQFQACGVIAPSTGAAVSFRYIAIGY